MKTISNLLYLLYRQVVPRHQVIGYETEESDLCCGYCCCCATSEVILKTSQKLPFFLPCIGKIDVPVNYDFASEIGLDQTQLQQYIYSAVQKNSTELHAASHLISSGISKELNVREDLKALLSPSADTMDRGSRM